MPYSYASLGYATATITGTANTLSGFSVTIPSAAKSFVGYVETANIRMRDDGTAPTSTEGVIAYPGDRIVLNSQQIRSMQFIRTTATSGVIKGNFYSIEANGLPV